MSRSDDLRLTVFLRFFATEGRKGGSWLKDKARTKQLAEALVGNALLAGLTHGRVDDDDLEAITPDKAAKLLGTGREVLVELSDGADDPEVTAALDLRNDRSEVRLMVRGEPLAARASHALDDLIGAVQAVVAALAGAAGLSDGHLQADFNGREFDFPRPRPPRENSRYPERSIVTFIDGGFHASEAAFSRPGDLDALTSPAPAAPAKVSTAGGLTTVRFARTLDDAELTRAASDHAQWIADRIDTDLAFGFNEEGDQLEERGPTKPMPPLTLYDREYEIGYKAVVVFPDGTYERGAWDEAKKVAKAGKLPDGTVVTAVKIVVPLREHCAVVADAARTAGFDAVVYGDSDGNFWNPDPPGNWRPAPEPKGTKSKEKESKPRSRSK